MFYSIMKPSILIFILLLAGYSGQGQSLSFYADAMVNANLPENRKFAAKKFAILFEDELKKETSLTKSFSNIPSLSIQYPSDSTFRVITWQIDHGNGRYQYEGYLQTDKNQITKFGGRNGRNSHDNNSIIDLDQWKGGLVYKILTPKDRPNDYYLLTFRMINQFTKVKTLEPLAFVEEQFVIGKKGQFLNDEQSANLTSRMALLYSADANAGINYDEATNRLIFDNLVVVQGRMPKQGPTAVPDGSYRAYELTKDGHWTYVDKLFDQVNSGPLNTGRGKLSNQLFNKKN